MASTRGSILILAALIWVVGAPFAVRWMGLPAFRFGIVDLLAIWLIPFFLLSTWGSCEMAAAKGYHPAFGALLCLTFNLIGILFLYFLPDERDEVQEARRKAAEERLPPLPPPR